MANDLDLKVRISAELGEIRKALAGLKTELGTVGKTVEKSNDDASRSTKALEKDINKVGSAGKRAGREAKDGIGQLDKGIANVRKEIATLVASFSALYAAKTFVGITDEAKQLEGKLRQVVKTEQDLVRVQQELRDISNETRTSFASTVDIYSKLARSTEKLGLSNEQLAALTEQINKLGTNSQTPIDSLNAALFQFGQSLESGVFQAEELNSVLDGAPALARAIRDGIQATGVGAGKTLKQMSADGELTVETVLNAILRMRERTEADFAKVPKQAGTALQSLSDEWKKLLSEFDKKTGISDALISGITWLRENLPQVIETVRNLAIALALAFAPAIASKIAFIITSLIQMQNELRASVVAVGKLQAAFLGLAAFIIGWEIGTYLRERFEVVEKAGIAMAAGIHKALVGAWGIIKASFQTFVGIHVRGFEQIATAAADLLTNISEYARKIPGIGDAVADGLLAAANKIRPSGEAGKALIDGANETLDQTKKDLAKIDDEYAALFDSVGDKQGKSVASGGAVAPIGGGGTGKTAGASANQLLIAKADIEQALKDQDALYQNGTIKLEEYYARKRELSAQLAAVEIQDLERQLAAADKVEEKSKLLTEIEIAKRRAGALQSDLAREESAARKKRAEETLQENTQLQADIADAEGRSMDARMIELEAKYRESIKRMQAVGNTEGVKLAEQLFNDKTTQIQFDEIQRQFDKLLADLAAKEQSLANRVRIGDITQAGADRELEAARANARGTAGGLIQQQQGLAGDNIDLTAKVEANKQAAGELQASATGLTKAHQDLSDSVTQMEQSFAADSFQLLADGIGTAFGDMISGAKSAKQAFDDFARGFAQTIAKMVAEYLAKRAILSAISAFGGGGAAAAGGGAGGLNLDYSSIQFHKGGVVGSGGTRRSINPAVFAMAPRYHTGGVAGLKTGEIPAILQRGEVIRTQQQEAALQASRSGGGGVRIINTVDPSMVSDFMASSQGEQVLVNVIQRNAGAIRQAVS